MTATAQIWACVLSFKADLKNIMEKRTGASWRELHFHAATWVWSWFLAMAADRHWGSLGTCWFNQSFQCIYYEKPIILLAMQTLYSKLNFNCNTRISLYDLNIIPQGFSYIRIGSNDLWESLPQVTLFD